MSCPIESFPPALVFPTKSKYQLHCTEKTPPWSCLLLLSGIQLQSEIYIAVKGTTWGLSPPCPQHCKRTSRSILSKSQINSRPNGSFINPGMFAFYGRTSSIADKDVPHMQLESNLWRLLLLLLRFHSRIHCNWNHQRRESSQFRNYSVFSVLPIDVPTQTRC